MAIADPRTYAEVESKPDMASVLAQAMKLMQQLAADKSGDAAKQDATLSLIEKLITKTHPENIEAPGVSVYSHPEGELEHPKEPLRYKMSWVGYELQTEALRPDEIELLNRIEPGAYSVTKADGTRIPFRVEATLSDKLDDVGRPTVEELRFSFPCKGDHRQNHMPLTSYLRQALGDHLPSIDEAMQELARLKAELAVARSSTVGAV